MTKQEFWATERGKQLSEQYIGAKGEFQAALDDPLNALEPVSVYRRAFGIVCANISDAITHIDARMGNYYHKLAENYGVVR